MAAEKENKYMGRRNMAAESREEKHGGGMRTIARSRVCMKNKMEWCAKK